MVVVDERRVDLARLATIGERLGRALVPGDVVLLFGPLGAGKTTLIRIIAHTLGVTDPVRSPSFTIANIYEGPVTVNHLDLYRLDSLGEEDALALSEYLTDESVTLVEWPEAGLSELEGQATWRIWLEHETAETRRVLVECVGESALVRWNAACEGEAEGDGT